MIKSQQLIVIINIYQIVVYKCLAYNKIGSQQCLIWEKQVKLVRKNCNVQGGSGLLSVSLTDPWTVSPHLINPKNTTCMKILGTWTHPTGQQAFYLLITNPHKQLNNLPNSPTHTSTRIIFIELQQLILYISLFQKPHTYQQRSNKAYNKTLITLWNQSLNTLQ